VAEDDLQPIEVRLNPEQLRNLERFQEARSIASRDAAVGMLLDIAFEAVTATGRRFWDRSIVADAPVDQARALAERLRAEGHATAADRLQTATAGERIGHALLEALREASQTVLTTIEALDPKTQLLAEELRLEIDKLLLK
jgi:hypothetical protein